MNQRRTGFYGGTKWRRGGSGARVGQPKRSSQWQGSQFTHGTPTKKPRVVDPRLDGFAPFGAATVCLLFGHSGSRDTANRCKRCRTPVVG